SAADRPAVWNRSTVWPSGASTPTAAYRQFSRPSAASVTRSSTRSSESSVVSCRLVASRASSLSWVGRWGVMMGDSTGFGARRRGRARVGLDSRSRFLHPAHGKLAAMGLSNRNFGLFVVGVDGSAEGTHALRVAEEL